MAVGDLRLEIEVRMYWVKQNPNWRWWRFWESREIKELSDIGNI
jgi:hypothetical protein